jgi:hypothetical protein
MLASAVLPLTLAVSMWCRSSAQEALLEGVRFVLRRCQPHYVTVIHGVIATSSLDVQGDTGRLHRDIALSNGLLLLH